MQVIETALREVVVVVPQRIGDRRAAFFRGMERARLRRGRYRCSFVRDNHTCSSLKGTLHGLHYQTSPAAQGKLVRVSRGAIFDVVVDIRRGSSDFRRPRY